jgi:hypothetical protein
VDVRVRRLGPNSFGEELTPSAVDDCYLGLLVDQPLAATLPTPGSLLVVGPSALLDARVRQRDGRAVYDLVTGHPDRSPRELVFLADLAVELRAWQDADWRTQGIDVDGVAEGWCSLPAAGRSVAAGTTTCRPGTPRRWVVRRWTTPAGSCATG